MSVSAFDIHAAASTVAQSLAPRGVPASQATMTPGSMATGTSSSSGGDISSNDFLTLLVTEMKNQDPTQPTDPNAYIQQLVGVNSLQQLIAINKDLTAPATAPTGSASAVSAVSAPSI